jgi:hypothetical protein
MGLGDDIKEFEQDATGQGGRDGDNNADNSNGSNDKTEDTLVDSGMYSASHPSLSTHRTPSLTHSFPAVDQFASKEGMPAGFDPEVNNVVNDEINKF